MSKMIQIRSVPNSLHRELIACGIGGSVSSDYLLNEICEAADRPNCRNSAPD
jgi:hypothetical protein